MVGLRRTANCWRAWGHDMAVKRRFRDREALERHAADRGYSVQEGGQRVRLVRQEGVEAPAAPADNSAQMMAALDRQVAALEALALQQRDVSRESAGQADRLWRALEVASSSPPMVVPSPAPDVVFPPAPRRWRCTVRRDHRGLIEEVVMEAGD